MKNDFIKKAVRTALLASATAALTIPAAYAADEDGAEEDRIVVTGSRLKRSDIEGALPITVIDREQIELSGESNAADFLRNLTFNSVGSFRPQSGSSAQGTASISLRGIGSGRTLVLIDGRRLPKSGSTGADQDLNVIPLGAIERVEILSDGASAVYGSDAIGGVVNIITRSDFEGAEISLGRQSVSIPANGGDREQGSIVFGTAGEKSKIIGGVSWNDRDIIFARDLPWNNPGASVFGNSYTTVGSFNWTTIPGACNFPGTGFFELASGGSLTGTRCAFDFTGTSADEASIKNKGLFMKASYEINDDWGVYMDTRVTRTESFGRYAPVPDSSYFSSPLSATSPNNPTNPLSPVFDAAAGLAPQQVDWWHRFDALGNRDNNVINNMTDVLIGATGVVGDVELDFGLRRTDNRTNDIGQNYLLRSAAETAIESGAYSLLDPYSNSEDVLNSLRITVYRDSVFDQEEAYATAQFDLFELAGGTSRMLVGAEYRKEIYSDQYDPQSEAGQVGGSAGNSAAGTRNVKALAAEAVFPVRDNVELGLAVRHDSYSDYGSNTSPKASVRYQPLDNLTLRASFGQGFRAPSLPELTQKPAFSATTVADPQSCIAQSQPANCTLQINDNILSNPGLQAEESDQYSIGAAYEPFDWLDLTVDYGNIQITNQITAITAQAIINSELGISGTPVPPGLGCTRLANGAIASCNSGFGNQGELEVKVLDFNVNTNFDIYGGKLRNQLQWSRLVNYNFDDGESIAYSAGVPKDRLVITNSYALNDFTFGYNLNYIGPNGFDANRAPSWVTHDIQFNYDAAWDGRFTVGVRNLGEKFPPIGLGAPGSREYDFGLYDGYGRIPYFRYTQTF